MSLISSPIFGGYWPYSPVAERVENPPTEAQQARAAKPGEQAKRQNLWPGTLVSPFGVYGWSGGCTSGVNTGCGATGFWGWGEMYCGTPAVWRAMLAHPKIAHARSQISNAILASEPDVEVKEGTPEQQVQYVKDVFFPLRRRNLELGLLGLDYGCAAGEVVWTVKDGGNWIERIKPLEIDMGFGRLLVDDYGNCLGIRWPQPGAVDLDLIGPKAWVYTHDRLHAPYQDVHGRPRLENVRDTAWRGWLDCWQKLAWALSKLAGVYLFAKAPQGNGPDGKSYLDSMLGQIQALSGGQLNVVGVENLTMEADPSEVQIKGALAAASLVDLTALNMGDMQIGEIVQALIHYEGLLDEGMLRSPRSAGSGNQKHSGRADTGEHIDNDVLDCQLIAGDIDDSLNEGPVGWALELKFGKNARGNVKLKTKPLQDDTKDRANNLLMAALPTPTLGEQVANMIGMDDVVRNAGYTAEKTWEQAKQEQAQKAADLAKQMQQQKPQGNNPPPRSTGSGQAGGNGNRLQMQGANKG